MTDVRMASMASEGYRLKNEDRLLSVRNKDVALAILADFSAFLAN
jgi:hypothetical protein